MTAPRLLLLHPALLCSGGGGGAEFDVVGSAAAAEGSGAIPSPSSGSVYASSVATVALAAHPSKQL